MWGDGESVGGVVGCVYIYLSSHSNFFLIFVLHSCYIYLFIFTIGIHIIIFSGSRRPCVFQGIPLRSIKTRQ